ncbi:MAG: hypothetical protein ALECFALPRED_004258 [Alectoria fallacina]|uniref:Uncharacterized protein n=1 Tax=Alectoria fallacina TaxID=1903189 RepID=A0A8H3IRR9_9LECA|nr:MAG: hypothetical protein ALECFALPRED_004258 [Alectoria fallacina]
MLPPMYEDLLFSPLSPLLTSRTSLVGEKTSGEEPISRTERSADRGHARRIFATAPVRPIVVSLQDLLNHPILAEKLPATIRKENGTGNLSSIAEKIRWNYSPNAAGAPSQGREPSANASPVYHADGAQLPIPRHGFEQTPTGFQGYVQPESVTTRKFGILSSITRIGKTLQQFKRDRPA